MRTPSPTIRPHPRDYAPVFAEAFSGSWLGREVAMRRVCDILWDAFGDPGPHTPGRGISWVGFYLPGPRPDQMSLAVRRNKPACSPIGLHGMCGRSFQTRQPIIVDDIATLGAGYIACDPKDRSELVLPCLGVDGSCWGVLDVDSWDLAAFHEDDAKALAQLLTIAGLSSSQLHDPARL